MEQPASMSSPLQRAAQREDGAAAAAGREAAGEGEAREMGEQDGETGAEMTKAEKKREKDLVTAKETVDAACETAAAAKKTLADVLAGKPTAARRRKAFADALTTLVLWRKAVVRVEELADHVLFNYNQTGAHNMRMVADTRDGSGVASAWTRQEAFREVVSNWFDQIFTISRDVGYTASFAKRSDVDSAEDIEIGNGDTLRGCVAWEIAADIGGVCIGAISFVRTDDGTLHAVLRNAFTCVNVLKMFCTGFTTKATDADVSGKHGEGANVSMAHLTRYGKFVIRSAGRLFGACYAIGSDGKSCLTVTKVGTIVRSAAGHDTTIHVAFSGGRDTCIDDVFIRGNFLVCADTPPKEVVLVDGEVLLLDPVGAAEGVFLYAGKLYVHGVFVTILAHLASDEPLSFAFLSKALKRKMERDRGTMRVYDIQLAFGTAVRAACLAGTAIDDIFNLLRDSPPHGYWLKQALSYGRIDDAWRQPIADTFTERHPGCYPTNMLYAEQSAIEYELGMEPVKVTYALRDVLEKSGRFPPIATAVARALAGRATGVWPSVPCGARRIVATMLEAIPTMAKHADVPCHTLATALAYGMPLLLCTLDAHAGKCVRVAKRDDDAKFWPGEPTDSVSDFAIYVDTATAKKLDTGADRVGHREVFLNRVFEELAGSNLIAEDADVSRMFFTNVRSLAEGVFTDALLSRDSASLRDPAEDTGEPHDDDIGSGDAADGGLCGDVSGGLCGEISVGSARGTHKRELPWDPEAGGPLTRRRRTQYAPTSVGSGRQPARMAAPEPVAAAATAGARPHSHAASALTPFDGGGAHGAQFFHVGDIAPTDVHNLVRVAAAANGLLRDVFKWEAGVTFGVYDEASPVSAFTEEVNDDDDVVASTLFLNAHGTDDLASENVLLGHLFAVICHEITHMHGYGPHDEAFASRLTALTGEYFPAAADHLASFDEFDGGA